MTKNKNQKQKNRRPATGSRDKSRDGGRSKDSIKEQIDTTNSTGPRKPQKKN